jgi:hypothetical protein
MKSEFNTFNCSEYYKDTKRLKPFRVVKCQFFYQSDEADKRLIDELIAKGTVLAEKVNPKAANKATKDREYIRILNNCVAGLVAEYLWQRYLNRKENIVVETTFSGAKTQVDLQIISNGKKVEVRSSFPYAQIHYVLCHGEKEFDVLGPYANSYKAGEIEKDFYVRTLFRVRKIASGARESFIERLKGDTYEAYLTGGASFEMMLDDAIAKNKDLVPEDSISITDSSDRTAYRVVPFSKALDTPEMYEVIYQSAIS